MVATVTTSVLVVAELIIASTDTEGGESVQSVLRPSVSEMVVLVGAHVGFFAVLLVGSWVAIGVIGRRAGR